MNRKEHWENIYSTKALTEVSWYQANPETSLNWIRKNLPSKDHSVIDIGGGDSFLVDMLVKEGYTDITVLDISEKAIERAKTRLGESASGVNWIVSDITQFESERTYFLWHDRAAFHFLTDPKEVEAYKKIMLSSLDKNGKALIGAFSENGPLKCSGIEIHQYSKADYQQLFSSEMVMSDFFNTDHRTPFDTVQNFNFAEFSFASNSHSE